jgi:hypothetical protein
MLIAIAIVLIILWVLGFFVVHIGGGFIQILLIIAIILFIYSLFVSTRRS